MRPEHPLAAQEQVTLAEIRRYPLACFHIPAPLSRQLAQVLGSNEAGLLSLAMECENALVLREYALRSDAVVLAPQNVFTLEVSAQWLHRLRVPEIDGQGVNTPLRTQLGLFRLKDRTLSTAAEILAGTVRQVASTMLVPA